MTTAETETIDAILRGERDRYGELVERHQKMVYGIAWSHLGDAGLAEDAAQEAFVKAYRYLATLRDPSRFSGWLASIARNIPITCHLSSPGEKNFTNSSVPPTWASLVRTSVMYTLMGISS